MNPSKLKSQVEATLNPLIDTRLIDMGRAHTMQWLIFSPIGFQNNLDSKSLSLIEYALHIQCTWRIREQDRIFVASDDLYFPAGGDPFQNLDDFDWTPQGSNRLDERSNQFLKIAMNNSITVQSIEADFVGGLYIHLNKGYCIDIFPANSLEREYWRFFNRISDQGHFVITGKGIEQPTDK